MAADGVIAVDWGTTNRRIYVLGADGAERTLEADGLGVTSIAPGGFPAAIADLRQRHGDRPAILAGMIGSTRGWIEAPYLPCPVTLPELADRLVWPEPGRTAIVPGIRTADDVMRGEEVQLLGAVAAGLAGADASFCHPGTHAKWAVLEGGALVRFRTVMTGELFALLRGHGILAGHLGGAVEIGEAFDVGVRRGLTSSALPADLFAIRADVLLGARAEADAASYASGLLIGNDVRIGLDFVPDRPVALVGDPALTRFYAAALALAGRAHHEVDGEVAFLAGIRHIAERRI